MTMFALKDVVSNPFRDLQRFGYQEWRITKLMDRISSNGFDANVVGRVRDGKLQLAFGHHRVEALNRLGWTAAEFIVEELTDEQMLCKMVQDNDAEFPHYLEVVFEAVEAAVAAFANNTIKPVIEANTAHKYLRYAPWYWPNPNPIPANGVPYTALSVARAVGRLESDGRGGKRASSAVTAVLTALQLMEVGVIDEKDVFMPAAIAGSKNACAFVSPSNMMRTLNDLCERRIKLSVGAQKASADAAAHVLTAQHGINAVRKEEAEKQEALSAEIARLPELADEAIRAEADALWDKVHDKQRREKEREPERRREARALNKKLKAAKAAEEQAREEEKRAARAAAKARAEEPPQYRLPHLTETIKYFEQGLPKCAIDVLKDRALLTISQKQTLRKSIEQLAKRMKDFWTQID
jgi:hypothetical protein